MFLLHLKFMLTLLPQCQHTSQTIFKNLSPRLYIIHLSYEWDEYKDIKYVSSERSVGLDNLLWSLVSVYMCVYIFFKLHTQSCVCVSMWLLLTRVAPKDHELLLKSIYLGLKKKRIKLPNYNLMVPFKPLHRTLTWAVTGYYISLSLIYNYVVIHVKHYNKTTM